MDRSKVLVEGGGINAKLACHNVAAAHARLEVGKKNSAIIRFHEPAVVRLAPFEEPKLAFLVEEREHREHIIKRVFDSGSRIVVRCVVLLQLQEALWVVGRGCGLCRAVGRVPMLRTGVSLVGGE